ncbi:MAG: succinate dehydrogenase cytochrome b558 subunit, partial [Bdellovibrionota bacterium]
MSTEASIAVHQAAPIPLSFWKRKLHSLTGVVPIGAFLAEHFWTNSYSTQGAKAFDDAVVKLQSMPYVVFMEIGLIGLPILYHAFYGIYISLQGRPNNLGYNYGRNWMYFLQRITGFILLIYIGLHVYETRIESALHGELMTFEKMAHEISEPGMIFFYFAGVLSATFHFANGLWAFLIGWGITVTLKSQRMSAYACFGVFLLLSAM